jgi:hypothetical protein
MFDVQLKESSLSTYQAPGWTKCTYLPLSVGIISGVTFSRPQICLFQ